ncbi:MAG TPA: class II fructose-bisphosphatase [Candidatus Nanoarchaeia archaeon]|nr:class II fructose-bisphosphatase [Candidatus Nanoarchaeia archaeon]
MVDRNLALEFVRATEEAAMASARWMGRGNKNQADHAAVEAMRRRFSDVAIKGTVVIGEGEMDEAPMLYIGEKVGTGYGDEIDIAVDPLEGTSITARGDANALSVLAAAKKGCLLHAPDMYMDKIAVGAFAKGAVDLDASVKENLEAVAGCLDKKIDDVTVVILDRDRHKQIICDIRECGARIRLISDGDVAGALAPAIPSSGVDILLGSGGAPEGVIAAAAIKAMGGDFQGRLAPQNKKEENRAREMGILDIARKFQTEDLVKGDSAIFCASGVTDGTILRGVRFVPHGAITHSLVMRCKSRTVRFIEAHHHFEHKAAKFDIVKKARGASIH